MRPATLTHGERLAERLLPLPRLTSTVEWLFEFYVFGNVHIALCAVALTLTTQSVFHLHLRSGLLAFVFCGTLFGYNLQRLPSAFESAGNPFRGCRHQWNKRHRAWLTVFSVVAAIGFTWSALLLYPRSQIVALVPAVLSVAYAFPVMRIPLREIPGIKIFVIAITWACSCALLPIVAAHHEGEPWRVAATLLWALLCGLLVCALTVPFDIRDLHFDDERMKTLPAFLGERESVMAAIGALAVSSAIAGTTWHYFHTGNGAQCLAYFIWCAIAAVFIYKSSPERDEYYFSFAIDGLLLLLWGMVWIAKAF